MGASDNNLRQPDEPAVRRAARNARNLNGGSPEPRWKRFLRTVFLVVLLAAGIDSALWAHRLFFSPAADTTGETLKTDRPEVLLPPPSTAPGGKLLNDTLRETGLHPVTDHPAGIDPPGGSRNGLERRVRQGEWVRTDASYDCPGTVEDVAQYYSERAVRKGFRPVSRTEGTLGWRRILFSKRQMTLIVALRKRGGEDKMVKVIVTLISPARR